MEPQTEKRRYQRHKVTLDIQICVFGMKSGKSALTLKGTFVNLSRTGAKVFIQELGKEQASMLLQVRHKCTLIFTLPMQTSQTILRGEIVWVDMQPDETAHLGIELDKMIEDENEILGHYPDTVF